MSEILRPLDFLERLMVPKEQKLGPERFDAIIQIATEAVTAHKVQRSITDWPFEHFWQNPNEPRHSRLLGYFINTEAEHGCGDFLLGKLFDALQLNLPKDNWNVAIESSHIDILLTRKNESGNYAIIIENKVNGATDQEVQLQRYVDDLNTRGFKDANIYVRYLPLTWEKDPTTNSLGNIKRRAHYEKITFDNEILGWLDAVLKNEHEWPKGMRQGMCDNLAHYRDLITYLITKQKERIMNTDILKKLSETTTPLPTWNQVESLREAVEGLQPCIENVLRGRLIFEMRQRLNSLPESVGAKLYDTKGTLIENLTSAFDSRFEEEVNVGAWVNNNVFVCIGVNCTEDYNVFVFTGFMYKELPPETLNGLVQKVGTDVFADHAINDQKLRYVYGWDKQTTYANAMEPTTVSRITEQFLKLRKTVAEVLSQTVSHPKSSEGAGESTAN